MSAEPASSGGRSTTAWPQHPTLGDPEAEALLDRFGFAVIEFASSDQIEAALDLWRAHGTAPDDPQVALYFAFHSKDREFKWAMHNALVDLFDVDVHAHAPDHQVYLASFITKWTGQHSGFGPHQDPSLLDERYWRGVSIWLPLVDTGPDAASVDNGMLHVVPGSHRFRQTPRIRNVNESEFAELPFAEIDRYGVGVPTRRGQAIVFDDRLIHYSVPNRSSAPRPVVTLGIRPSNGYCVLARQDRTDEFDIYRVADSSFIDITASAQALWQPESDPIAVISHRSQPIAVAEFRSLCEASERIRDEMRVIPTGGRDLDSVDPGMFCAFCGTTEELIFDSRTNLGKSQLVCRSCHDDRATDAVPGLEASTLPDASDIAGRISAGPGYVVLPGFASSVAAQLRDLVDRLLIDPETPYFCSSVHCERDVSRAVDQQIKAALAPVLDRSFPGYKPFMAAVITKGRRHGGQVEFHQDWTYTDERRDRAILVWIPLVDVREDNGALRMVAGSHRWTTGIRPGDDTASPTTAFRPELSALAEVVPLGLGDAVAYDPGVIHGSRPNTGEQVRDAIAVGLVPSDAALVHFLTVDGQLHGWEVDESFFTSADYRSAPVGANRRPAWAAAVTEHEVGQGLDGRRRDLAASTPGGLASRLTALRTKRRLRRHGFASLGGGGNHLDALQTVADTFAGYTLERCWEVEVAPGEHLPTWNGAPGDATTLVSLTPQTDVTGHNGQPRVSTDESDEAEQIDVPLTRGSTLVVQPGRPVSSYPNYSDSATRWVCARWRR